MKVIGITGSPRNNSYSTRLLRVMLTEFAKANWDCLEFDCCCEKYTACTACNVCHKTSACTHNDTAKKILAELLSADALVLSSPVYFFSISSQLKRFIDRCQPLWVRRFQKKDPNFVNLPKKPLTFIAVAGGPPSPRLFTSSEIIIEIFANTTGFEYEQNLKVTNSDNITQKQLEHLENQAQQLAKNIITRHLN